MLKIEKVYNGYTVVSTDLTQYGKSWVFETGNELEMLYVIQKYFGFVAISPEEEEGGTEIDKMFDESDS